VKEEPLVGRTLYLDIAELQELEMKRSMVVVLSLSLVASGLFALPANAKKKAPTTRKAYGTYQAPATVVGNCTQTDGVGCMTIQTGSNERFLKSATVTDATGQPVAVEVSADLDGDIQTETSYGTFCGELTEPLPIDPGVALVFWVGRADTAAATACVPGVGTQGRLDVVFSTK
jgi:hypothetical protein